MLNGILSHRVTFACAFGHTFSFLALTCSDAIFAAQSHISAVILCYDIILSDRLGLTITVVECVETSWRIKLAFLRATAACDCSIAMTAMARQNYSGQCSLFTIFFSLSFTVASNQICSLLFVVLCTCTRRPVCFPF